MKDLYSKNTISTMHRVVRFLVLIVTIPTDLSAQE